MKFINKSESPKFFEEWKNNGNNSWSDIDKSENSEIKRLLRKRLLTEQGYICCYCGDEVDSGGKSVIEHIKCKEKNEELQLDYNNLLISCNGGRDKREGKSRTERRQIPIYCDAYKKNKEIKISPLDGEWDNLFNYGKNGELTARDNNSVALEIIKKLNIGTNNSILKNKRKAILNPWFNPLPTKDEIKVIIDRYSSLHGQKYKPFSNVVVGALKVFL